MARKIDPFGIIPKDSLDLECICCSAIATFSRLFPDAKTHRLGKDITEKLLQEHKATLAAKRKYWDGQYCFISKAVLEAARKHGFNPVTMEVIRRGYMPWEQIPTDLKQDLSAFATS